MEATYSITVHNKFSLALDEDEDPLEVLKVREQEREAKKKEKLSEKENKSKQPEAQKNACTKPPKPRVIKDAQQPPAKIQEPKKDQGEFQKFPITKSYALYYGRPSRPRASFPLSNSIFCDFPAFARILQRSKCLKKQFD